MHNKLYGGGAEKIADSSSQIDFNIESVKNAVYNSIISVILKPKELAGPILVRACYGGSLFGFPQLF